MARGPQATWSLGAALAASLLGASAAAQPSGEPIRVTYAAPPTCPSSDEVLAQVFARTTRARAASPGESARQFNVHIEQEGAVGARYRGRLEVVRSATAPHREREVTAATCGELVEALAFFIALAIDPDASAMAAPRPPAPAPAPPPAPTPVPTPSSPPPRPAPAAPLPAHPPRGGRWYAGGGSGPALVGGVAPNFLLGARAVVEVTRSRAGAAMFSPSFSLAGVTTSTGAAKSASGTLALRWQALVGSACPVVLQPSSYLTFRPCAVLEVGVLRGDGVALRGATRNDAAWTALGLSVRGEIPLAWRLFLELELGGSSPVVRPRFSYTSGTVAFDTAPLGARAALALTLHL